MADCEGNLLRRLPAARSLSTGLPLCPEAMATAGGLDLTSSLRWAGTCTSLHYEYEFLSIFASYTI